MTSYSDFIRRQKERSREFTLDAEGFVKAKAATSYMSDANQLCVRAKTMMDNLQPPIGYGMAAKIFVDILMSFECSLKSLVISLSKKNESPEEAYRLARSCNHKVDDLQKEVQQRARHRIKFLTSKERQMLREASDLGVFRRYEVEAMRLKMNMEDGFLFKRPNRLEETIDCEEWMHKMRSLAFKVKSVAREARSRYMTKHLKMKGSDVDEANDRLKKFVEAELR